MLLTPGSFSLEWLLRPATFWPLLGDWQGRSCSLTLCSLQDQTGCTASEASTFGKGRASGNFLFDPRTGSTYVHAATHCCWNIAVTTHCRTSSSSKVSNTHVWTYLDFFVFTPNSFYVSEGSLVHAFPVSLQSNRSWRYCPRWHLCSYSLTKKNKVWIYRLIALMQCICITNLKIFICGV